MIHLPAVRRDAGLLHGSRVLIGGSAAIDHTGPLTALGFDVLDTTAPIAIDMLVNGVTQSFASPLKQTTAAVGPLFLGVVDAESPFLDVRLFARSDASVVSFDCLEFGSQSVAPGGGGGPPGGDGGAAAVPVPAGGAPLLGALAALGLHRRRGA